MAEIEGFEPPQDVNPLLVFKTSPFSQTWVNLRNINLSIVKHAVQYHHGTVELHSEEGKGTTICILLPKE